MNLEDICSGLFAQGKQPDEVATELQIASATATKHYKSWTRLSYERGQRALAEDRRLLYERLKTGKP